MLFQPPYQPNVATQKRYGIAVGDTINIGTVNNRPGPGEPTDRLIVTGHRETERQVRLGAEGRLPGEYHQRRDDLAGIFKLGVGKEGSWFYLAHRSAVPANKDALNDYVKQPPMSFSGSPPIHL